HGQALGNIAAVTRRPPGRYLPNQMPRITGALLDGRVRVLFLLGTDMLSSFADAEHVAAGLVRTDLVVTHDLFMNDTARRFADVVLPATSWLEELGCKSTNTHLYLMPRILDAPGEARSLGLPALPVYVPLPGSDRYPLSFRQGRTLTQFHGFYDHGQALPTLARADPEPKLWVSPADAAARGLEDGAPIRIFNDRGEFRARAHVTD